MDKYNDANQVGTIEGNAGYLLSVDGISGICWARPVRNSLRIREAIS
jgi:hypothetical protein